MPRKRQQRTKKIDNDSVLDQIERVVRWGDEFRVAFVKCNHPAQRETLRHSLLDRLRDQRILEISLEKPIVSLLDEIRPLWNPDQPPVAMCIYGLEHSLWEQGQNSPVLGRLNHERDLLRQSIPAALLIWLPDYFLDYVVRGAPDFWAWRSGVYEFPTEKAIWQADSIAASAELDSAIIYPLSFAFELEDGKKKDSSFDVFLSYKRKDILAVRQLAQALKRRGIKAWLDEQKLVPGRPWQETLEEIIRTARTAAVLVGKDGLGPWEISEMRAILSEFVAHRLPVIPVLLPEAPMQPELPLFLRGFTWVDLRSGLTEDGLNRLAWGITGLKPSSTDEALRQADNIFILVGSETNISPSLFSLNSKDRKKETARLEQLLRTAKNLPQLDKEKQRINARLLSQLGLLNISLKRWQESIRNLEEALKLFELLQDRSDVARTLYNIGGIYFFLGHYDKALIHYKQALTIFVQVRSSHAVIAVNNLKQLRTQWGEEKFDNAWHEVTNEAVPHWLKSGHEAPQPFTMPQTAAPARPAPAANELHRDG